MLDPISFTFWVVFLVIAFAVLFSLGSSESKPEDEVVPDASGMVDIELVALKVEIVMNAVESNFYARHLVHEAEGARQMRAAVRGFLEGVKIEQQQR